MTVMMHCSLQHFTSCVSEFAESLPGSTQRSPYPTRRREFALSICVYLFSNTHCSLKAYCAIWDRRSNFRHQASPRLSPRESTQRRKVELWARNVREVLPKCQLPRYIYGSLICRKATTWDRRLYFPSEGRRAEEFFALIIRRILPGANSRTWVPKASTLPLDHRSRCPLGDSVA
jgi:hypothetical protein